MRAPARPRLPPIRRRSATAPSTREGGYLLDEWTVDWKRFRLPPAETTTINLLQFATPRGRHPDRWPACGTCRAPPPRWCWAPGAGFQKDSGLRVRLDEMPEALLRELLVRAPARAARGYRGRHGAGPRRAVRRRPTTTRWAAGDGGGPHQRPLRPRPALRRRRDHARRWPRWSWRCSACAAASGTAWSPAASAS